jgi:phosphohistidine phosphatase
MKRLYVLRHGQAAPEAAADTDHARQLTTRGRLEVRRAAAWLLERAELPSLVLASSGVRAKQTAELCLASWPHAPELRILDELYLAGPSSYVAALADEGGPHETAMVVGHNPGLEALVHFLTERSEHLPTAALVEIDLPVTTWADLSTARRGLGRFVHAVRG